MSLALSILTSIAGVSNEPIALGQETGPLKWANRTLDSHRVGEVPPVVTGLAPRPGTGEVAIVGDDHIVHFVDAVSGRLQNTLPGHEDWIRAVCFSPEGSSLLTAGTDRRILRWDLNLQRWETFATESASIETLAYSADGNWVASAGFSNFVHLYDSRTGRRLWTLESPTSDLRGIAFSPDSAWLVAGGRSGNLIIWSRTPAGWELRTEQPVHKQRIHDLAFVGNSTVVTVSEDRTVQATELGAIIRTEAVITLPAKLYSLAVLSPKSIAVGGSLNRIHIIDLEKKSSIGYLENHRGTVSSLAYIEGRLISGGYDAEARVWQAEGGAVVASNSPWVPSNSSSARVSGATVGGSGERPVLLPIQRVR